MVNDLVKQGQKELNYDSKILDSIELIEKDNTIQPIILARMR